MSTWLSVRERVRRLPSLRLHCPYTRVFGIPSWTGLHPASACRGDSVAAGSLRGGHPWPHCHSPTGVIRTAVPDLDRESQERYEVVIQATDMAGQLGGLSGSTTVTIVVTDVNDNPPRFPQSKWGLPRGRWLHLRPSGRPPARLPLGLRGSVHPSSCPPSSCFPLGFHHKRGLNLSVHLSHPFPPSAPPITLLAEEVLQVV